MGNPEDSDIKAFVGKSKNEAMRTRWHKYFETEKVKRQKGPLMGTAMESVLDFAFGDNRRSVMIDDLRRIEAIEELKLRIKEIDSKVINECCKEWTPSSTGDTWKLVKEAQGYAKQIK